MIVAIGIDIVEIKRIEVAMKRNDNFVDRILTNREKDLLIEKGSRSSALAASFAAKEAVSKVLGTGIGTVSWQEIEILNDEQGAPFVVLHGKAALVAQKKRIDQVLISITHDKRVAYANALGQRT